MIADGAGAVGRAVDFFIMDDDDRSVFCKLYVEFDFVRTRFNGFAECKHRIFRINSAVSAVCNNVHKILPTFSRVICRFHHPAAP